MELGRLVKSSDTSTSIWDSHNPAHFTQTFDEVERFRIAVAHRVTALSSVVPARRERRVGSHKHSQLTAERFVWLRIFAQPHYVIGSGGRDAALTQHVDQLRPVVRAVATELKERLDHGHSKRNRVDDWSHHPLRGDGIKRLDES